MTFKHSIIALCVFLPSVALAQQWESDTSTRIDRSDIQVSTKDNRRPIGWWPFLSVNLGLLDYDGNRSSGDGQNLQAKGLMSYYDLGGNFILEGGLGVQTSDANDKTTASALIEAASRVRWLSRWEAGPVLNIFVGEGDRYGSSSSDFTSFVGGNVLYTIPLENNDLLRVGGRWVTDIGIPNEFANIVMFEVHYGFPFSTGQTSTARVPRHSGADHLARRAFSSDVSSSSFLYSTRQIEPNSTTKRQLSVLARELLNDEGLVSQIRIVGHSDERGSVYANQMLSKARAQAVANTLIFSGFPKENIEVVAMGENRPLSKRKGPQSWDANRRVELEFKNVSDSDRLEALLKKTGLQE